MIFHAGFIATSNSFTPNIFQVIFLQLQLVFGYWMNKYLIGNKFSGEQTLLVVVVVLFNLLMIGNEVSLNGSIKWTLFWQLIFALSQLSGVTSNILTEAYFKSLAPPHEMAGRPGAELKFEYCKVVVMNVVSSSWMVLGQLAVVYIVFPVNGHIAMADLFSDNVFTSDAWSFYLMLFGSMGVNITQTILFRYVNLCPFTIIILYACM